jgi:hypothetical protein
MIEAQGDGITLSSNILFADFDQPGDPAESILGAVAPLALEYLPAPGDSGVFLSHKTHRPFWSG